MEKILFPLFRRSRASFLFLVSGLLLLSCKAKDNTVTPDPPVADTLGKARVWLTRGDRSKLFNYEGDLAIRAAATASFPVITVDTSIVLQTIDGFGAALTGSSAWLLHRLPDAARSAILRDLFDPSSGIGISFLRMTIGASDFSTSYYTYDDLPSGQTDFTLEHFSLAKDTQDVIPVMKEILQVAPTVKLLGSPWSPPAWMKTNASLIGGKLKPECYSVYASYFTKYMSQMQQRGIPVSAVTPQNEPLYAGASYPCMEMLAAEQAVFVRDHLGQQFQAAGIHASIVVYDHNWDHPEYPISVMNDAGARQFVAGSAFHGYGGDVSAMSTVHYAHPDRFLWFTEISGGTWAMNFSDNLMWNMRNIFIGSTSNWSSCALLWNLALDQNGAPHEGGSSTCRGVVTIHSVTQEITKNEEYYSIAHFSKFVRPGSVRIGSVVPQTLPDIGAVAFRTPAGSRVMVVTNYGTAYKTFTIREGSANFTYSLSGKSIVTFVWGKEK